MYVLYAWMREADDAADDASNPEAARARLEQLAAQTSRALAHSFDADDRRHLWVGLGFLRDRFGVDPAHFRSMIEGQLRDLEHEEFDSFDQLREYCELVASSVGLLCIQIWGASEAAAAEKLAVDRGIAFQLTNVLRDFAEDYDRGRVYLPAEDFRRHAISPQILRSWSEPARCARFMNEQIDRARGYYERSARLEELVDPDCRPVLAAMTGIYRSLLERIALNPAGSARGRRARLSTWRKMSIAANALRSARRRVPSSTVGEALEPRG
jgi:phytoene synthase